MRYLSDLGRMNLIPRILNQMDYFVSYVAVPAATGVVMWASVRNIPGLVNRIGIKSNYAKKFIEGDPQYGFEDQFQRMFYSKPLCVENFVDFFNIKNDNRTV